MKYNVKHKVDVVTTTGGGSDQTQMMPNKQVVARVLGEGSVLQDIDGGLDTEDAGEAEGDQNVPNGAPPDAVPSTSAAPTVTITEPVSITVN